MKIKYLIGTVALAGFLAGCNQHKQVPSPERTVSGEDVKEQVKKTAVVTQEYFNESKDEAVAAMQRELQEMDTNIAELKIKAKPYADTAKTNTDSALSSLQGQRDAAAVKFEELKEASADKWKDVKAGFDSAMSDLKKKYDDLKSKF